VVIPQYFIKVTPLSKVLAMVLFVILPFAGFWLGKNYQAKVQPREIYVTQEKIVSIYPTESPDMLSQRCGEMPPDSKLNIISNHFSVVNGPYWSPDCRNIAWSYWQSGPMGVVNTGPGDQEGLFVYSEKSEKTRRIVNPTENDTIKIIRWDGNSIIHFYRDGQKQEYQIDISSKEVQKL
jgi:hypothetical protein